MTHAPIPVTPPDEQAPKPENPEPLQQPIDPEKRGSHPPAHEGEHPQNPGPPNAEGEELPQRA